jgi:uncharacterized protein
MVPGAAFAGCRAGFLARVYGNLLASVVAFVIFEIALFRHRLAEPVLRTVLRMHWLAALVALIACACLFHRMAYSVASAAVQYAGLFGYVLLEGLLFAPLLWATEQCAPGVIRVAAPVTLLGFGSLSYVVFRTRYDFSFLESFFTWAGILVLVLIAAALVFGLHAGLWLAVATTLLAGASILYYTPAVLHSFADEQHAGAALELFASIAQVFWDTIDWSWHLSRGGIEAVTDWW